jgi:hypothetical protein
MLVVSGRDNELEWGVFLSRILFVYQCSFFIVYLYIKIVQNIHVPTFFTSFNNSIVDCNGPCSCLFIQDM